jgi:hypothetical protein
VNELVLYVDYLKKEMDKSIDNMNKKQVKYFETFKQNLLDGIEYYHNLVPAIYTTAENFADDLSEKMHSELNQLKDRIAEFELKMTAPTPIPVIA